jgi:hypothetical protein
VYRARPARSASRTIVTATAASTNSSTPELLTFATTTSPAARTAVIAGSASRDSSMTSRENNRTVALLRSSIQVPADTPTSSMPSVHRRSRGVPAWSRPQRETGRLSVKASAFSATPATRMANARRGCAVDEPQRADRAAPVAPDHSTA